MLPLRHEKRWRIAGIVLLLFVLMAAITPTIWLWPDLAATQLLYFDKWLHTLTFFVLTLWFAGQYRRSAYWRLAVGLFFFGALIEVCQAMVVYRMAEWGDLAADMIGTAAGLVIAVAGLGGWSLRFEQWLESDRSRRD